MGSVSAHAAPVLIASGGCPSALRRVLLGSSDHSGDEREAFIQKLVYDHPESIPMADIAPPLMPLVSVCMELPTAAGALDNLWITPEGGIVLGECQAVPQPGSPPTGRRVGSELRAGDRRSPLRKIRGGCAQGPRVPVDDFVVAGR